mmetsp:Transcript_9483/g.22114  ORF Transcript_9483/g.22114 Transcript_9483/m.22114 type:complete len:398 (+) Transcript_9483:439-1632(+)
MRDGRKLLTGERAPNDAADFYASVFEVGRRFKIMSPDKLRSTYGKLVHVLMDAAQPDVRQMIGFSCVEPIQSVYGVLLEADLLDLLEDPELSVATFQIVGGDQARHAQNKAEAVLHLCAKYAPLSNGRLAECDVERILHSLGDANAFLAFNRRPVERMLELLREHFPPKAAQTPEHSLCITIGREGARLSHSHSTQFAFVDQSLRLWNEIMSDFYRLWTLAEEDLLDGHGYRLRDTGQGLNRVKDAPKVSSAMHRILNKVQASVGGSWVGSSVVHMGDTDVPNALVFIDKYTQVPRILRPIVDTVDAVPALCESDPSIAKWVQKEFGSAQQLQRAILTDFFRHGFDGSGANNYYDAGSCIDGRLTSAWNWCSRLEKKPFCLIFSLAGNNGFDGDFSR